MPGDRYTPEEILAMTPDEFASAKSRGFDRIGPITEANVSFSVPAGADLTSSTPSQINVGSAVPKPEPRSDVWSTKRKPKDFVAPSGQTCLLMPLQAQTLLEKGILDRITRLEGLAADLVDVAEGQPPSKAVAPSSEDLELLLETLGVVIPLVVVEPKVYGDDDKDAPEGAIRVRDIDLEDRIAILEESMKGLKALDRFRPAG